MPGSRLITYAVMAVVVAGVLFLRMRRLGRVQPLKLERLWIVPALLVLAMAVILAQAPPRGISWVFVAISLAVGGALGWVRGATMAITVEPETQALNVKASPAAIAFLVVLVLLRYGLRSVMVGNAGALHLSTVLITDLFLVFAVGLLGVQRIEMFLRARRLLAAARNVALPS